MNNTTLTLERYEWCYFFVASYLQNFRRKNSLCKLDRQQPRIASPMAKLRALVSKFACKKIHHKMMDSFTIATNENFFFLNF